MVVNTASKCGLTVTELKDAYDKYKDDNNATLNSKSYAGQFHGTNEEIAEFCRENYGVTFPMMSKVSVLGLDQHPIYSFLTSKALNGKINSLVTWNSLRLKLMKRGLLLNQFLPESSQMI